MRNPFFVARLGAFTVSFLLLLESVEPGYGIDGSWAWYLALLLLTLATGWDLLSLVASTVALLLLTGLLEESRAAYIALTLFTGIGVLRPRDPIGAARFGYRAWRWKARRGWQGSRHFYTDHS